MIQARRYRVRTAFAKQNLFTRQFKAVLSPEITTGKIKNQSISSAWNTPLSAQTFCAKPIRQVLDDRFIGPRTRHLTRTGSLNRYFDAQTRAVHSAHRATREQPSCIDRDRSDNGCQYHVWLTRGKAMSRRDCKLRTAGQARVPLRCASDDCIALLVRLSFDRSELSELLCTMTGDTDLDDLRLGPQYRRLIRLVHEEPEAACALDSALASRLQSRAQPVQSCPLFDLANLWSRRRDEIAGLSAAALLWTVARQSAPCWRKLEDVMVEDLKYLAARSLARESNLYASHQGQPQAQ